MQINGRAKNSNKKLVELAFESSRTGYSSKPNSTATNPSIQVKNWVIRKIKEATAAFCLGINQIETKQAIDAVIRIIISSVCMTYPSSDQFVFFENQVIYILAIRK